MFSTISTGISERMRALEAHDHDFTRQILPDVGRLLALLASSAPPGRWVELGTSCGYSSLWLAVAAQEVGATLTTFEISAEKVAVARESLARAGVEDAVELVHGNAFDHLPSFSWVAFSFLDGWAFEDNMAAYDLLVPRTVRGGWIVIDNMTFPPTPTKDPFLARVLQDERVDAVLVPFAKGDLVCRRC